MGERDQESSAGRQGGEQGRQPARNRVSRGVALHTHTFCDFRSGITRKSKIICKVSAKVTTYHRPSPKPYGRAAAASWTFTSAKSLQRSSGALINVTSQHKTSNKPSSVTEQIGSHGKTTRGPTRLRRICQQLTNRFSVVCLTFIRGPNNPPPAAANRTPTCLRSQSVTRA